MPMKPSEKLFEILVSLTISIGLLTIDIDVIELIIDISFSANTNIFG